MKIKTICKAEEIDSIPFIRLNSYHWEAGIPYRPKTFFKLAFAPDKGFYCVLKCFEDEPKTVYLKDDSPIYRDSCLEFFLAPVGNRSEYINIECNSRGFSLCEFGAERDGRSPVFSLCGLRPRVTPLKGEENNEKFWGVVIFVQLELISALYSIPLKELKINNVRANFYKCGDDTDTPHYIAFSPVSTLPPGFHNHACFFDFTV